MNFSMHTMALSTFIPILRTLASLLDKAAEHAKAKQLDFAEISNARLAPDMYPLSVQIQIACHHPQDFVARATGVEPPSFESGKTDGSFDALKNQIATAISRLESVPADALNGNEDRQIVMPLGTAGLVIDMKAHQFLRDWSMGHFYFHVVTAYDILRHSGVELGKKDFMSHIGYAIRPA